MTESAVAILLVMLVLSVPFLLGVWVGRYLRFRRRAIPSGDEVRRVYIRTLLSQHPSAAETLAELEIDVEDPEDAPRAISVLRMLAE